MRRIGLVVVLALSFTLAPLAARAQPAAKVYRIGWLSDGVRLEHGLQEEVTRGLAELGYTEGKNVLIERRNAEGKFERLPKLARELVALKVDLIVTFGGVPATRAAKAATASIPIVMAEAGDPVGTGLVASLARPGGNVTGLSTMAPDITRKKLQLLREVAPKISRVATLYHRSFEATVLNVREAEAAALALGLTVLPIEMGAFQTMDAAFAAIARAGADALLTFGDPFVSRHQREIVAFAAANRLPAIYSLREFAEGGGLLAYGTSYPAMYRRAASYVDRILKGAKPADLPIEQPTKFELVINLKSAKAFGLTIPQTLLLRADQIIE